MNFLPGWGMMMPSAGGAAPVTAMSFFDHSISTAQTVSVPAGIQAGDLITLLDVAITDTNVVPTGFTSIATTLQNNVRCSSSYKYADGTETTISGMLGSGSVSKLLAVYRPNGTVASYSLHSVASQGTGGNPADQVVTSGSGTAPLIVFGFFGANGTVDPRTFSPAKDGEVSNTWDSNSDAMYIAWKFYNSGDTLANVTVDMDDEGNSNHLHSCYIQANAA